jgi:Na+/melibiose symporter-like transporter
VILITQKFVQAVALSNIFSGLFGKVVENAEGILDEVITTDEEREQAKLELKKVLLQAEREAFEKEVEDRKSARDLYKDDALIQKLLATLFTVAYFGITFVMFQYFVTKSLDLGEFEISFISTIFGAMSAKVNTIIDFFFGGSSKKNNTELK